jgi:NAD(P)-dependent dehydrogenase (short-subunit alcohol dehydrogenase family)
MRPYLNALVATVVALVLGCTPGGADAQGSRTADAGMAAPPTVVITGANRGLGLEFAKQLGARGYHVIGTARSPETATELKATGASVEQLDVAESASVRAFAERLGDQPIDILINNAGILVSEGGIEEIDVDSIARSYEVNSLGPMRVTQALLPNLRSGTRKLVVQISSTMGSIARNDGGGYYAYRSSKAALNMLNRSLAHELEDEGFVCVVLHPGWVKTDMGGPNARIEPQESIAGMLKVIDGLNAEKNGRFYNFRGEELPW